MADMNTCTFTGRLTKDAVMKTLPTGTNLCTFDMACNTGFGQYEKCLYICVNFWGKAGANLHKYLVKGKSVGLSGELEMQKWISQQDGIERSKIVLNCNSVVLLNATSPSSVAQESLNDD